MPASFREECLAGAPGGLVGSVGVRAETGSLRRSGCFEGQVDHPSSRFSNCKDRDAACLVGTLSAAIAEELGHYCRALLRKYCHRQPSGQLRSLQQYPLWQIYWEVQSA